LGGGKRLKNKKVNVKKGKNVNQCPVTDIYPGIR
jgi:hypothetical protein